MLNACAPTDIRVTKVSPQRSIASTEEFSLPNCGGTDRLSYTLGTQVTVQKSVNVENRVKAQAGIEVELPAVAQASLAAEIERSYAEIYSTTSSRLNQIEMGAAPKTKVVYIIQWEEQTYASLVSFYYSGSSYETPYVYTMLVPKIEDSRDDPCPPTQDARTIVAPTVLTDTPIIAADTVTPSPTNTLLPTSLPTDTSVPVATDTDMLIPTVVLTDAPAPTSTPTPRPSDTPTATHTQLPTPTQTSLPTATSTETPVPPTSTSIPPTNTPEPVKCEGFGNLALLPLAPPNGCVLIVEWYIPANKQCGILFTQNEPGIADQANGTWWYVYPNRPDSHLEEYKQKYPHCEVRDLR